MSIHIEEITEIADFEKLRDTWTELHEQSLQADNIFLSHDWLEAWWSGFGDNKSLLVLLLRDQGELTAIAPMMKSRRTYYGLPIRVVSLITNEQTNRADFIIKKRYPECVSEILDYLLSRGDEWDLVEFDFLPEDSATLKLLQEQADRLGVGFLLKPSYDSPYIPIECKWDEFYASLKGHFRRNLKNREKRLSKLGKLSLETCTRGNGALDPFLDNIFDIGAKSWKEDAGTAIASTSQTRKFYTRLAYNAAKKNRLSLHLLRLDDKPIAFHYSLRHDNRLLLLKTEYDLEYRTYSPGHIIQKGVLEECFSEDYQEFDFLGISMLWKRDWTDYERIHKQALIFKNRGLSKVLSLAEMKWKPALKRSALVTRIHQRLQKST